MPKRIASTLSLKQLGRLFPTPDDAMRYFERVRWHGSPVCAKCGKDEKITPQQKVGTYWCGSCRAYFTVFTNTPMHRNKIDPCDWLTAAYFLVTDRKGISSLELSKKLQIKQQHAWYLLQRLRAACDTAAVVLRGMIEVDETFVGGLEKNKHNTQRTRRKEGKPPEKAVVLGMRQRDGKTVARTIESTDRLSLWTEIQKTVEKGSTLFTDDLMAYKGIERTFHQVSTKHLDRYVNEFAFRLNEGNCQIDTIDRITALFGAMLMKGQVLGYKALIGKA